MFLNSITNNCSKQAYVQRFDCEPITLKESANMSERMEIEESIYEGVVEPSYKKYTRVDVNSGGHIRIMRG